MRSHNRQVPNTANAAARPHWAKAVPRIKARGHFGDDPNSIPMHTNSEINAPACTIQKVAIPRVRRIRGGFAHILDEGRELTRQVNEPVIVRSEIRSCAIV